MGERREAGDVDVSIAEIAYCGDRLDVTGFAALTNIGGTYLGDPAFRPVLVSAAKPVTSRRSPQ